MAYEVGGGSEKSQKSVTYDLDGPSSVLKCFIRTSLFVAYFVAPLYTFLLFSQKYYNQFKQIFGLH